MLFGTQFGTVLQVGQPLMGITPDAEKANSILKGNEVGAANGDHRHQLDEKGQSRSGGKASAADHHLHHHDPRTRQQLLVEQLARPSTTLPIWGHFYYQCPP